MVNESIRATLERSTRIALRRLEQPDCDVRTVAEQLDQTARLMITEIDAEESERPAIDVQRG